MRELLGNGVIGVGLGFILSRIGFSSWDEVHRMFGFVDPRMLWTFFLGVSVLAMLWPLIARLTPETANWVSRKPHPGTVAGSVLFGAGWAISGACPSIVLVQIGEGQLIAAATLVGILLGNWIYSIVHERFCGWDVGSCLDE